MGSVLGLGPCLQRVLIDNAPVLCVRVPVALPKRRRGPFSFVGPGVILPLERAVVVRADTVSLNIVYFFYIGILCCRFM